MFALYRIQQATCLNQIITRSIQTTAALNKAVAGKTKRTRKFTNEVTYEESYPPHHYGVRKWLNSMNTSNLLDEERSSETMVEDLFIRKFIFGTWHRLFLSKIIIKRRANMIFISGIFLQSLPPRKIYFLIGYTEEILSYFLKCPVKLELQSTDDRKALIVRRV